MSSHVALVHEKAAREEELEYLRQLRREQGLGEAWWERIEDVELKSGVYWKTRSHDEECEVPSCITFHERRGTSPRSDTS